MNGSEVRALTEDEITVELERLRKQLFTLRTQSVTDKVEDTSQYGKIRRDIARILGEKTRRAIEAKQGAEPATA